MRESHRTSTQRSVGKYGSKASVCIARREEEKKEEKKKTAYFLLISSLKVSYRPEGGRLHRTHAGKQKASPE